MPTYEYECRQCRHRFELFQSITEDPVKVCPKCRKSSVRRLFGGGLGIIFKGSGFYTTDYKRSSSVTGGNGSSRSRSTGDSGSAEAGDRGDRGDRDRGDRGSGEHGNGDRGDRSAGEPGAGATKETKSTSPDGGKTSKS